MEQVPPDPLPVRHAPLLDQVVPDVFPADILDPLPEFREVVIRGDIPDLLPYGRVGGKVGKLRGPVDPVRQKVPAQVESRPVDEMEPDVVAARGVAQPDRGLQPVGNAAPAVVLIDDQKDPCLHGSRPASRPRPARRRPEKYMIPCFFEYTTEPACLNILPAALRQAAVIGGCHADRL